MLFPARFLHRIGISDVMGLINTIERSALNNFDALIYDEFFDVAKGSPYEYMQRIIGIWSSMSR